MAGDVIHRATPILYLWPLTLEPPAVPFAPRAQFSGLLITHLPNAAYLQRFLAQHHRKRRIRELTRDVRLGI